MSGGRPGDVLTGRSVDVDVLDGATAFRDLLAPRFGPSGQKLMLVTGDGVVVTSDLHRLLDAAEIEHPVARLVAAGAVEQKERVGDGSLATTLLVGSLADRTRNLLERGLGRATIADGFARAGMVAADRVDDYARSVAPTDGRALEGVARGALASVTAETRPGVLRSIVDSARLVHDARGASGSLHVGDVEFRHFGGDRSNVELIRGTVLEEAPVSDATPRELEDVGIAVVGGGRKAGSGIEERSLKRGGGEPGEGRTEVTFTPEAPEDVGTFKDAEVEDVDAQVDALIDAGAGVVFCTMGISDVARARLVAEGIPAFRTLTGDQSRRLARAVGARVVMHLPDVAPSDVGRVSFGNEVLSSAIMSVPG